MSGHAKKNSSGSIQLSDASPKASRSYRAVQMTVEEPVIVPAKAPSSKPSAEAKKVDKSDKAAQHEKSDKIGKVEKADKGNEKVEVKKTESSGEREKRKREAVRRIKSTAAVKSHPTEIKRSKSDDKKEAEKKEAERKERDEKKKRDERRKAKKSRKVPLANKIVLENGATDKTSLVVYWAPNSPSPNIVILFLHVAEIPYKSVQFQWQDTAQRENRVESSYWKLNPNRSIPTIVDGDFVLFESHTIIRYLAEKYCGEDSVWYPANLAKRAKIDNALEWNLTHLRTTWLSILHSIMGQRPELVSDYWGSNSGYFDNTPNGAISTFARFEREWLAQGDYVAGMASPTVADVAMFADFSFSYTLLHLDHGLTPELYPALHAWNGRMRKFLKNIPQYQVYSGIQNALAAYFPSPPEMPLEPRMPWHDYLFPGVNEDYRDLVTHNLGSELPWPSPAAKDSKDMVSSKDLVSSKDFVNLKDSGSSAGSEEKSPKLKHHKSKSKGHSKSASKGKSVRSKSHAEVDKKDEAKAEAKDAEEGKKAEEEAEAARKKKAEEEAEAKKKTEEEAEAEKKRKEAEAKQKSSSTSSDESPSPRPEEVVNLSDKPVNINSDVVETKSASDEEDSSSEGEAREKKAKEETERKAKEEAEAMAKAEEEARKAKEAEEEQARKAKEEEEIRERKLSAQKKQEEEEAENLKMEEQKRWAEAEAKREAAKKAEEEARLKLKQEAEAEAEAKVKAEAKAKAEAEAEAKAKAEAEARAKAEAEATEAKRKAEAERKRKDDEDKRRKEEEETKKRKEEEEKKRKAREEPLSDEQREAQRIERLLAKKKAEQQDSRDYGGRPAPSPHKVAVSPAVSLTSNAPKAESSPAKSAPVPAPKLPEPDSDSESSSDEEDEDDPEPLINNFIEHAKWEERQRDREVARERKKIEKDMKKRGLAIPAFKPKAKAQDEEDEAKPVSQKPQFSNLVEEAKWEEEQRNKEAEKERRALGVASPRATPTKPQGFQGMVPVVPKEKVASPNLPRMDTAKSSGIAAKLKAMREQEEARQKALKEVKEAEAKKKKEAEEAWKQKQVELSRQKEKELASQPKASASPADGRPEVVSSAPTNPLEELERIKKEAAAKGSDSYFAIPKE